MAKIHEILGVAIEQNGLLQAMLDTEKEAHLSTISVLKRLKSGEIRLEQLEVEGNGWTIRPAIPVKVFEPVQVTEKAG